MDPRVWYASYGSNLARDRFRCYVEGGRPPGAARVCPGCRDTTMPSQDVATRLPGRLHFAWRSPTWGGGIAFYDPSQPGETLARAYRVTVGQLADVVAQEMHRTPGADLDLRGLPLRGRLVLGPGRYETLHLVGEIGGEPVITFSHSEATTPLDPHPPSAAYLAMIVRGLREAHGLDDAALVAYLGAAHGIGWAPEDLADLCRRTPRSQAQALSPPCTS